MQTKYHLIIVQLFLYLPMTLYSQDFSSLFSGRVPLISLNTHYHKQSNQEETSARANLGVFRGASSQVNLSARFQELDLDLSENKTLPSRYRQIDAGIAYTQSSDPKNFWTLSAQYGSASDKPFENSDVSTLSLNYVYRFSPNWIFLANYSNNRSFLNNIPLPSIVYVHTLSRERTILLGVPFLLIRTPISEKFGLSYTTLMPYTHKLSLTHQTSPFIQTSINLEQSLQTYLKYQRENSKDQIYFVRRSAYLSFQSGLSRNIRLAANLGHAFGQRLFEAESFGSSSKSGKEKLKDGAFAKVDLNITF